MRSAIDFDDSVPAARPSAISPALRAGLVLLVLTGIAYSGVLLNGFVDYDDPIYVTSSRHVQQGITLDSLRFAWTTTAYGNWHPLTWMSLMLDHSLFGLRAWGYHATSLLLHLATVVMLFDWLRRSTGSLTRSFAVAALFAVHPLHVESVAWIAERKDVLSTFWLLATLIAYRHYSASRTWANYGWVTAAFACGLLSKSMLVTTPVLLMLVDFWPAARLQQGVSPRKLVWEKLPWLAMSLGVGLITMFAQSAAGNVQVVQQGIGERFAHVLLSYGFYLSKTFWPVEISPYVPYPAAVNWSMAAVWGITLLAVTWLCVRYRKERPWLLFGWSWFVISLLPVIGVLQVGDQAWADRYSYIPHIGLLTMLVWEIAERLPLSFAPRRLRIVPLGVALVLLTTLTSWQVSYWRSSSSLWNQALAVSPDNWLAHHQLAVLHTARDEFPAAITHFERLRELRPNDSRSDAGLGAIAVLQQRWAEAEPLLLRAIELNPKHPEASYNLYLVRCQQDNPQLARAALEQHCAAVPSHYAARLELGLLQSHLGAGEQGLRTIEAVIAGTPEAVEGHLAAAKVLRDLKRDALVRSHLQQAYDINPLHPELHALLGDEYLLQQNAEAAAKHYKAAVKLSPGDEQSRRKLELLQAQAGG